MIAVLRSLGIELRPDERSVAMLLFGYSFLMGVFQFSSKAVRQASYVDSLGADKLPYVFLAVALIAYPFLRFYGRVADRFSRERIIGWTMGIVSIGLVGFWWLMKEPAVWVSVALYLWISVTSALTLSQLWTYANSLLDARQARRLFGFIGSGSLLGGVLGGQATVLLGGSQPRAPLLAGALVLSSIGLIVLRARGKGPGVATTTLTGRRFDHANPGPPSRAVGEGLEIVRRSGHLRLIATIMLVTVIVAQIVDVQFSAVVEESTTSLEERTRLFGNLYSVMALTGFIFQIVFTARIHRRFGVGFAMKVLPTFVLVVSSLFLVGHLLSEASPTFGEMAWLTTGLLILLGVLRVGEYGLRYSLDHATRELLFVPIPAAQRVVAKAYIDVLVHRFAKGIAAIVLLTVTVGWVTYEQASWMAIVLAIVWLACTEAARRQYVESLRRGLAPTRQQSDVQEPESEWLDPNDVTTLEVLIESLGSTDSSRVIRSIDLLAAHGRSHLVPPLLLYHDEVAVRLRTLEALKEAGREEALPLIEKRLGDADEDVRAAAILAWAELSGREGRELVRKRLDDKDARVRSAVIVFLANQSDEDDVTAAEGALVELLMDSDPDHRMEAAKALGSVEEPTFQQHLVKLLYDADTKVIGQAIEAVRKRSSKMRNPLYVPILISLMRDRRLKHAAREALVAFGESVLPALKHFLTEEDETIWVRRALPKTIARLKTPGALDVLYESFDDCKDRVLRRKIVEALESFDDLKHDERQREGLVEDEARAYLEALVRLAGICGADNLKLTGPVVEFRSGYQPAFVEKLLYDRLGGHRENIFSLLALGADRHDMLRAKQRLLSDSKKLRARALEYLDNVLWDRLRRPVMAVVDDSQLTERLALAERRYGFVVRSREETLRGLLNAAREDPNTTWLGAGALLLVAEARLRGLFPDVEGLVEDGTGLLGETAHWVHGRVIA